MRPHAEIIPLWHAPGTRLRRERIEVSIIVPFNDEASVFPHCLERQRRIGERLAECNRYMKRLLPGLTWRAG